MIRREELEAKAQKLVDGWQSGLTPLLSDVKKALLSVERECLTKVLTRYTNHVHDDLANYPDQFVTWLRDQLKEVEG